MLFCFHKLKIDTWNIRKKPDVVKVRADVFVDFTLMEYCKQIDSVDMKKTTKTVTKDNAVIWSVKIVKLMKFLNLFLKKTEAPGCSPHPPKDPDEHNNVSIEI